MKGILPWMSCLFLIQPVLLTGKEIPRIFHFSTETYQTRNQNWMIAQGPDHILYFANSEALMVYDGARWYAHPLPEKQIVRAVAIDDQYRIFTGGFSSFGYWEKDSLSQLRYTSLRKKLSGSQETTEEIWQILTAGKRVLFQSFSTIFIYDGLQVQQITPPGNIMFSSLVHGRVLVPVIDQGIYELTLDNTFVLLKGTGDLATFKVATILPYGEKGLLIGTQKGGMFSYRNNTLEKVPEFLNDQMRTYQLNRAIQLSNGNYMFGTILNGLYVTDQNLNLLYHISKENGLNNNTVLALFEDKSHQVWVGMDRGIDMIEASSPLVFFNDEKGTIGTVYDATTFNGKFYVGTNQGLYVKKDQPGNSFSNLDNFKLREGTQGQVWYLKEIDNQLLCGNNDGVYKISSNKITQISSLPGGWQLSPVPAQKNKLIQASYTGIGLLENTSKEGWKLTQKITGFDGPLKKIIWGANGNAWGINPHRGLYRFKFSDDVSRIVELREFSKQDGLPTDFRLDIFQVGGEVAIKSGNSFYQWNEKSNFFDPITVLSGIPLNKGNYKILPFSKDEYFQIFPTFLIWKKQDRELRITLPLVPNYENVIQVDDGRYIFCLENGYAIFNGNENSNKAYEDKSISPIISEVVNVKGKKSYFPSASTYLSFPASQNHLQFFAALPSPMQESELEYQLEGFQTSWLAFPDNHQKEFTNLSTGDYVFKIRNPISGIETQFSFCVLPPWYFTWWAFCIYLLLAVVFIVLSIRYHRFRLHLQLRKLEIEKERQLNQHRIEAKNEQLRLDVLNKSQELANSTMNLIRKNEILMSLKEELSKSEQSLNGGLPKSQYKKMLSMIDRDLTSEQDWKLFEHNFKQVHEEFFKKLKNDYPELTPGDLKVASYLRMNLVSKEIAPLLNISIRGVENKRYRLRKKLNLPQDANVVEFLMGY